MVDVTIKAGQTLVLSQPLSFGGLAFIEGAPGAGPGGVAIVTNRATLASGGAVQIGGGAGSNTAHGAGQGGQVVVSGSLVNEGQIGIAGGGSDYLNYSGAAGAGGTLSVTGAMTNDGTIALGGGKLAISVLYTPGLGGILNIEGVLLNAGLIAATGNRGSSYGEPSDSAATIDNRGTLTNSGTIALLASSSSAMLLNVATLSTSGTIIIAGSVGASATFDNDGVATNSGLIDVKGGPGVSSLYGASFGGVMLNAGTLTNDGTIAVQGGAPTLGLGRGTGGLLACDTGTLINMGQISLAGGVAGNYNYFFSYAGGMGSELSIGTNGYLLNVGTIAAHNAPYPSGHAVETGTGATITLDAKLTNEGQIILYGAAQDGAAAGLTIASGGFLGMAGGTVSTTGSFGLQPALVNDGYLTGRGVVDVGTLVNNGVVNADYGTLTIGGNVDGYGQLEETVSGTLILGGAIGQGESLFVSYGEIITGMGNAGRVVNGSSASHSRLELTGGGSATLNAADTRLTVTLSQASTLTLSQQGFLTVVGSSGADTLVAEAAGQTLKGGGGGDTLMGSAATGDTFFGTAAQMNGDTIGGFAGTDVIDVTDLLPGAGLSLTFTQGSGQGALTLAEGTQSTTIELLGTFTLSQFSTTSDGAAGVLVHVAT